MKKQEKNISLINQQYLKELETNNNLFNQKIKNLNNSLLNSDQKKKKSNTRHIINNSQTIENNSIKNKFNFIQRDLNSIEYIPNLKNFTFRKKGSEKEMRDKNMIEINKELKKYIKQLENENENKDNIINDLKEKLKQNEKNKNVRINLFEYNRLILDIEDKNKLIEKLKNVIKNLKSKNEILNVDMEKYKSDNINLKNKLDNMSSETDYKINYLNSIKKINELELENNKLKTELNNLTEKYMTIKSEYEKLNLLNEEQNNIIFNYQKQLNTQSINNKNDDTNEIYDENICTNIEEDFKYKNTNLNKKENYQYLNEHNKNDNENNLIRKYNYNKYDYNIIEDNDINYNDNNCTLNKKKLNNLENYLSTLLKERCQLENELTEVLESPRTFSDIKLKSNINDKILINDNEIESTKNKLKKLRGY